ncbi:hypothetical protein [Spirosoma pulveris]
MKSYGFIVACIALASLKGIAQSFEAISVKPSHTETYFQRIDYYSAHQRHFVLTTFLKDSTLYRIDNYELLNQLQVHGSSPDTLNISVREGPTRIFYPGERPYLTCGYKQGSLNGLLLLFYPDGLVKRRELYKLGRLKKSDCYTPKGERYPCSPLYQPSQWNGDPKNLQVYLVDNLQPFMEKEQLGDLHLIFWISDLGQVSKVSVTSNSGPTDPTVYTPIQTIVESMPNWVLNQFNWKPALMDSVAIPEQKHVYLTRRQGVVSVKMP